jgi:hypothetical protein
LDAAELTLIQAESLSRFGTKRNVPSKFKALAETTKYLLIFLKSLKLAGFRQNAIALLMPKAFFVSISGQAFSKLKKQALQDQSLKAVA